MSTDTKEKQLVIKALSTERHLFNIIEMIEYIKYIDNKAVFAEAVSRKDTKFTHFITTRGSDNLTILNRPLTASKDKAFKVCLGDASMYKLLKEDELPHFLKQEAEVFVHAEEAIANIMADNDIVYGCFINDKYMNSNISFCENGIYVSDWSSGELSIFKFSDVSDNQFVLYRKWI